MRIRHWLILGLLGLLVWVRWSDLVGARWYPTRTKTMRRMLELAEVRPGQTVYDLGSGDGRILIMAAREFGAGGVGIEVDPGRHMIARRRVAREGASGAIDLVRADFFDMDVSGADVVTLYLRQPTNDRLEEKLSSELRPGARVVSNTYTLPTLPLVVADQKLRVYVYQVPGASTA